MSLKGSDGELCCPVCWQSQSVGFIRGSLCFPECVCEFLGLPLHPSVQLYLCDVHSRRLQPQPVISSWVSAQNERSERAFVLGMLPSLSSSCKPLASNRDDKCNAISGNVRCSCKWKVDGNTWMQESSYFLLFFHPTSDGLESPHNAIKCHKWSSSSVKKCPYVWQPYMISLCTPHSTGCEILHLPAIDAEKHASLCQESSKFDSISIHVTLKWWVLVCTCNRNQKFSKTQNWRQAYLAYVQNLIRDSNLMWPFNQES